jgi:hypothetical protein
MYQRSEPPGAAAEPFAAVPGGSVSAFRSGLTFQIFEGWDHFHVRRFGEANEMGYARRGRTVVKL